MASLTDGIKEILARYGSLIEAYRGMLPASFVAARIWHETRGNPKAYVPATGETGLLQVWPSTAERYGYPISEMVNPAKNILVGCKHWISEARKLTSKFPDLFPDKSTSPTGQQFWKVLYLYTAIGAGATGVLLRRAGAWPGGEFDAIRAWVNRAYQDGTLKAMWQTKSRGKYSKYFGTQDHHVIKRRVDNAHKYVTAAFKVDGTTNSLGLLAAAGTATVVWYILLAYRG